MSTEDKVEIFTPDQEARLRELMCGVVREYWTTDGIKSIAQDAAKKQAEWIIEDGISAKIRAATEAEPAKMVEQLFRNSGMVVKTKASEYFDGIVGAILQDEDSGLPGAIRLHVQENLPHLIHNAVTAIVAAMVVDWLKSGVGGATDATREIVRQAFMNASMQTRY